ncbi:MAG TPA: putative LPS assembly protein LptD [Chitinophagaceae bacterium]
MWKRYKTNINYISAALTVLVLSIITSHIQAKDKNFSPFFNLFIIHNDTVPVQKRDTVPLVKQPTSPDTTNENETDTTITGNDTARTGTLDTLDFSKDSIDAPIDYKADDSGVLIIPSKQMMLYGKGNAKYEDINLDANTIIYDQQTQVIKAYGGTDTSKGVLNKPELTQGDTKSISDTIFFNMKTQKGLTKNTFYNEQEIYVNAVRFKKVDKDVGYGYKTTFTTCNLDTPHFAFIAKKIKIINNKIAVSGPAYPEFEGVPIPVAIPFGIFPLSRGRHSGILPPQFAQSDDFGLGLENMGYYKVLNDNWDVTVRGNLYSYGGWSMNISPEYYKRYKYRGNLTLSLQKTKILNSDAYAKEEFTVSNGFFITWNHSTDPKARPGTTFTASVRAGSTKYNQYVTNNAYTNFQNQLSSSVTWSKTWDQGKYNLSVAGNHDQNNNLRLVNIRIPTVNFSASTIYPFQRKEFAGTPKWYEKLGISYNGTLLNQFSFYDSAFNFQQLLDTAQWGVEHDVPITVSLPPLGPLIIGPSISYGERWYGQQIIKTWDPKNDTLLTNIKKGFYIAREVSFGFSVNTRIFGTLNFPRSKGITAIRHEVKPFISLSYKPDLVSQYYRDVQVDTLGNTTRYSVLEGGVIGSFSEGKFGGINFGIDNLLEMKVKNKKDTSEGGTKKVKLIDGLGITSGYNFIADSFQVSPISINFRSTLFEKVNITGSASIDPYDVDTFGRRVDKLLWKEGKIGRFTNGSLAISTSLKSKSKDGKTEEERIPSDETLTPDEQLQQLNYIRSNPADFVDFNIPWNVQLSFSLNFSRMLSSNFRDYITQINSNLNVNGDFSLTPKWKIGGSTYFDFKTAKLQTLTMFITREMHCWQLAINVTPVGLYRSFNITINPKSGLLRDLRINRSRFFYNQ